VKRIVLLAAAALALPACSFGDSDGGDPAAEAMRTFVVAVADDDVDAIWEQMSSDAQGRYGGDRDAFRRAGVPELHKQIPRGTDVPDVDKFLVYDAGGEWTVSAAALDTTETAYAAPVREEDGGWKVDPGGKVLRLAAGPPHPGTTADDPRRVDFSVYSRARDLDASMWLDDRAQELRGAGGPAFTRYWAEPPEGLAPGTHIAVAFAQGEGEQAAIAWTFSAGLPG
jgi:hypothetical protein